MKAFKSITSLKALRVIAEIGSSLSEPQLNALVTVTPPNLLWFRCEVPEKCSTYLIQRRQDDVATISTRSYWKGSDRIGWTANGFKDDYPVNPHLAKAYSDSSWWRADYTFDMESRDRS